MTTKPLRVGIAGCGNIAGPYARTMQPYAELELVGATDVLPERAQQLVDQYGEKPIALSYGEAKQLVDLAADKGLRLSCSPITYMGEAQQTTWKMIRSGQLGPVRVVYAEVN